MGPTENMGRLLGRELRLGVGVIQMVKDGILASWKYGSKRAYLMYLDIVGPNQFSPKGKKKKNVCWVHRSPMNEVQ